MLDDALERVEECPARAGGVSLEGCRLVVIDSRLSRSGVRESSRGRPLANWKPFRGAHGWNEFQGPWRDWHQVRVLDRFSLRGGQLHWARIHPDAIQG